MLVENLMGDREHETYISFLPGCFIIGWRPFNVQCQMLYINELTNVWKCANEQENADVVFGGVTIFAGLVGTICGGLFLDYIGSTVRNAFKVCFVLPCQNRHLFHDFPSAIIIVSLKMNFLRSIGSLVRLEDIWWNCWTPDPCLGASKSDTKLYT